MKNELTAIANENSIKLIYGDNVQTIPVQGISEERIKQAFRNLGLDGDSNSVQFAVDNKTKPKIINAKHNANGQLIIRTDKKEATVKHPWLVTELDQAFNKLGINADDYESFCKELEAQGLPSPINASKIGGYVSREELSLPNLNKFGYPIQESKKLDPSLFADEQMSIGSLYAFPDIDTSKISLDDLFAFKKK